MSQFATWLSQTSLSLTFQVHEWIIPAVQSVHIIAIGIVLSAVLMVGLRVLDLAWRDQTLMQVTERFGPWLSWALVVLLLTGVVMVIGEPVRELMAFSFWAKMTLVAIGTAVALLFQRALRRHGPSWEASVTSQAGTKALAVVTFMLWICVVFLGRFIAYDHVWGSWSGSPKA